MGHIYQRKFVESEGTQLILPAGETNQCWEIGYPPAGEITRLIVRQSAGVSTALTVNLYDTGVCDIGSGESVSIESADPMTKELAKIIPTQSVNAGATLALRQGTDNGGPWSYRNREGTYTVPVRKVYLGISVAANVAGMEFEVTIECKPAGFEDA